VAKAELQNAADAIALAGAACLRLRTECGNLAKTSPDWSTADAVARGFLGKNLVLGRTLSSATVANGYWDATGTIKGLQSTGITPNVNDLPAVQVSLNLNADNNGGPVTALLPGILGAAVSMTAVATAAISSPGVAIPDTVFPLAIAQCMFNNYWNSVTGQPMLATAVTMPGLDLPQVVGQPILFKMTSGYQEGTCQSGDWTSFATDANDVSTIQQLISQGNPTSLQVGGSTWIEPGAKTALYSTVNASSAAGNGSCQYVQLPVVTSVATHAQTSIQGFACVQLLSATGGGGKYVVAQMSADPNRCLNPNANGFGPNYGIVRPPRLVQ
jgi:Putative Tad-like Flp pilus-assembly